MHEAQRVFADRLNSEEDFNWFANYAVELLLRNFRLSWKPEDLFYQDFVLFSDVLNLERANVYYEEIEDKNKLYNFLRAS